MFSGLLNKKELHKYKQVYLRLKIECLMLSEIKHLRLSDMKMAL